MRDIDPPSANDVRQRDGFVVLPSLVCGEVIDEDDIVVVTTFVEDLGMISSSGWHCYLWFLSL